MAGIRFAVSGCRHCRHSPLLMVCVCVVCKCTVIYRLGFNIYFVSNVRLNDVEANEKNENKLKTRDQLQHAVHRCHAAFARNELNIKLRRSRKEPFHPATSNPHAADACLRCFCPFSTWTLSMFVCVTLSPTRGWTRRSFRIGNNNNKKNSSRAVLSKNKLVFSLFRRSLRKRKMHPELCTFWDAYADTRCTRTQTYILKVVRAECRVAVDKVLIVTFILLFRPFLPWCCYCCCRFLILCAHTPVCLCFQGIWKLWLAFAHRGRTWLCLCCVACF